MHKLKVLTISIILVMSLALAGPSFDVSARPLAQTSPTLGAAESYSVLAGETVTNTGPTTMPGDLGVSPGSAVTGFPPGTIGPGTIHAADANAALAQIGNTAAFTSLDQGCTTTYPGVKDLVGENLVPGVYCADAFELSGTLTLSGSGVWIFKSAATLITSGTANVVGGDPCNVWWRVVSSATLGTNTSLIGNIFALTSISLQTGASLNGRALAQTGAVTLDTNTITGLICLAPPAPTATPTAAPTTTTTQPGGATATATPPAGATATATPPGGATATATLLPVVTGLPYTGGAPIRNEDFPWSLVIVGGFSAIALVLGVRAFRRTYRPKQ
ncbi:MAG: ice-binding family protein [Anaerolineales bacterium]